MPYPHPIPPAAIRRSSRAQKPPVDEGVAELEGPQRSGEDDARPAEASVAVRGNNQQNECSYRAGATDDGEPTTFEEAMAHADSDRWYMAMQDELEVFRRIGLYEEVNRPQDRKIIDSKWVFKIKRGPTGDIERYKARLVARGFTQTQGIDYTETFAPVTKFSTIRVLLALAAQYDLEIHQMDVKSAFLNGELDEEIYLKLPPGFRGTGDKVWRLRQALYGLKQAHKAWYRRLRTVFESLGFTRSHADHSVFYKVEDGVIIIVAVYVDDKLILSKCTRAIEKLKQALVKEYDLSDLGEARWILGMEIIRDRDKRIIEISQRRYVEGILERFGMHEGRAVATPIDPNSKLAKLEEPEVNNKSYQSALGALMYAMLATRPDLAFSVGALSRHAAAPGEAHWAALKRVYQYLRGTTDARLVYSGDSVRNPFGYVDADWASDINDRRSITGYVFVLANGAVSWSSKKQTSVALSSTEAEYMAASAATKEAIWIRTLIRELNMIPSPKPTLLLLDNQSAMSLAKNSVFHDRTKHISIRHHFIREQLEMGEVAVDYISTNAQVADILTKGLTREKHIRFTKGMGIIY